MPVKLFADYPALVEIEVVLLSYHYGVYPYFIFINATLFYEHKLGLIYRAFDQRGKTALGSMHVVTVDIGKIGSM